MTSLHTKRSIVTSTTKAQGQELGTDDQAPEIISGETAWSAENRWERDAKAQEEAIRKKRKAAYLKNYRKNERARKAQARVDNHRTGSFEATTSAQLYHHRRHLRDALKTQARQQLKESATDDDSQLSLIDTEPTK